jgi:hypothetical protein
METNKFLIIDDVFSEKIRNELYIQCNLHLTLNLLSTDYIDITKSIIDCHGLALTSDKYFPYSLNCWNVFCLEVKKHVTSYIKSRGIDEYSLTPFSCFAERNVPTSTKGRCYSDTISKIKDPEGQVKKRFIRSIYLLKNIDPNTYIVVNERGVSTDHIKTFENRLVIFDGTKYRSTQYYPRRNQYSKCCIIFDWYINEPFHVPDWILP